MANPATLQSLTDRVRSITDNVGSAFISDAEIAVWLNVGLSKLHDILVVHFEDYYENIFNITTVANQADYALPDNFYKLQGVDLFVGTIRYSVPRFMNRERNRRQNTALPFFADLAYRIVGNSIRFIPTPGAAAPVVLQYSPTYSPLRATGDLVEQVLQPGWEEFAVLDAAIQAKVKDEYPPQDLVPLQTMRQDVLSRIEQVIDDRDGNESGHVVDITRGASFFANRGSPDSSLDDGDW